MKVLVVGAGIVGMATAYWLARSGFDVTVLDSACAAGQGTSFANGGQLSYGYVAPLSHPSVLVSLPKWLLNRESPVRFLPSVSPSQWWWVTRFLKACTLSQSRRTTENLLWLSSLSREAMDVMLADTKVEFGHRQSGKLVFYSSRPAFDGALRQYELQSNLGCRQKILTAADCLALEPRLSTAADRLVGGIYSDGDAVGDCQKLCLGLQHALAGSEYGVRFIFGVAATQLLHAGGRVLGINTTSGIIESDLYVLSNGMGAKQLAATVGYRLPLYPIRGYSISPDVIDRARAPLCAITDQARHIAYASLDSVLRVVGYADIGGSDDSLYGDRIRALTTEVNLLFPGACSRSEIRPWSGKRPATPTGNPVIGRTRIENLFVNVGHGALGFTLACGSGRLLADLICAQYQNGCLS